MNGQPESTAPGGCLCFNCRFERPRREQLLLAVVEPDRRGSPEGLLRGYAIVPPTIVERIEAELQA